MEHAVLLVVGELVDAEPPIALRLALTRLKRILGERGVWLEVVMAATDSDPAGLTRELMLLADPDTRCLVLVGPRYGAPTRALPTEVRTALPELVAYQGSSRTELFARCALEPGRRSRAVFALAPDEVAPNTGSAMADHYPRVALARLRADITGAGASVVELGAGGEANSTAVTELILDRLLAVYPSEAPQHRPVTSAQQPPQPAEPAPAPLHYDENVQFTVYRPRAVRPDECYELLAFAHLADRRPDAPADQLDPLEEVRRQARALLGPRFDSYSDPRADSRQSIPRAGELTFLPQVAGVEFTPERRVFRWLEDVQREEFQLRASPRLAGRTARGRLSVYLGAIIVAEVDLAFTVDWNARSASDHPALQASDHARPYRKIFASYSHQDTEIVEQFELLARSMGDEYLRDVVHLRAGSPWDDGLLELIDRADVFQLFWSSHSMRSPHVRREWEYAVQLGRPYFIRPTYWEDPLPSTMEPELPPSYLRALHFHQIRRTEQQRQGTGAAVPGPAPASAAPRAAPASSSPPVTPPPVPPPPASPPPPPGAVAGQSAGPPAAAAPGRRTLRARFVPLGSAAAAVGIAGSLLFSPLGSFRSADPPMSSTTSTRSATPRGDGSPAATSAPTTVRTTASVPQGSPDATPNAGSVPVLTEMEVTGAEVVAGSATQRPGDASSVFEVSRGQQVALALTFSNEDTSQVVRVGAQLRCRDDTGAWGRTRSEITQFPVPGGEPGQGSTDVWNSKPIVVPQDCRVGSDSDEPDGELTGWAEAKVRGSRSERVEIVAELRLR